MLLTAATNALLRDVEARSLRHECVSEMEEYGRELGGSSVTLASCPPVDLECTLAVEEM